MNDDGELLQLANQGEVVVRGATVMHGYIEIPMRTNRPCQRMVRTGDWGFSIATVT